MATRVGQGTASWIYFDSARTGEQQIFKMPATGGEAVQLTRDGGFAPLESSDAKFLYYTKGLSNTISGECPWKGAKPQRFWTTYLNTRI